MKIVFFGAQDTFIRPFIEYARNEGHEVKDCTKSSPSALVLQDYLDWADVAWFEWCDKLVARATKLNKACKIICRLHSYEVFTDLPRQVAWSNVDLLIFVSRKVKDIFASKMPHNVQMKVIPNGVDLTKFFIPEDKVYGKKVASVGYINYKKNPSLLLYCYKKLRKWDPEISLHIAGQHQDPRIAMYMTDYMAKNKLPIAFDNWVDDVAEWLKDKDFVISTSLFESFQYSVAEGMASGLVPLIHCWPGSEATYPGEYIFTDPDDCLEMAQRHLAMKGPEREVEGVKCRRFIEKVYDAEVTMRETMRTLDAVVKKPIKTTKAYKNGVTLVMVVRNEEKGVGNAINSVRDLVDEAIVLMDDTTTDNTKEVAEKAGAQVILYKWEGDFSKARNLVTSKVDTKWTLVLDGHEYLETGVDDIRTAIKENPNAGGFFIHVRMEDKQLHKSIRLHKTENAEWRNAAHNVLVCDGPTHKVPNARIIHDRFQFQTPESRRARNEQREEHLLGTLFKNVMAKPKDTRSMFYLAQQHRDAGRYEAAYYWYERYCRTKGGNQWDEEMYLAWVEAAKAVAKLNDGEKAVDLALYATRFIKDRAEAWVVIGDVNYKNENFSKALEAFTKASKCELPTGAKLWVEHEHHKGGWAVLDRMAMCLYHLKQFEEGKKLCEEALKVETLPDHERKRIEANVTWHQRALDGDPAFDSTQYWEQRYKHGGTSGGGSYGKLAEFKGEVINGLIKKHEINSLIDHGCGDGNQLALFEVEKYIGLDVSPKAIEMCEAEHPTKPFYLYQDLPEYVKGDCGLSLDVVYHLVEDQIFHGYMKRVFDTTNKLVVIYAPNKEMPSTSPHIKYREFTKWVEENAKGWALDEVIEQKYPYDPNDADNTSLCDFYVFIRKS
jgi:glycosyltransferase involved in cell wall biosynthesis